ncbi:MAG: glycoside hydrolase family 32 protein [Gemmatimonadetes bacterium]|jgi:beta-fructofuranosidase|nr:glycoside hydrolase family 32 protein [Gemmatimonadota bacterium]MBT6146864.1 glycoside hydrolase family 32 protein [Gemmatimonadota bacterium]MBT7859302.1 glycoside hydrolase family 32 protein [Gemmatimonadota bacterium]
MNDYTSKVPFYTFPETLEAQEQALADNPLMQRLTAARAGYAADRHRPRYHYVNPEAMLNDPNGLCYWQGRWHLFYQAYPPEDTRQHWGHAVSDDLVHWRDLPYCIYPDPERCCFSGAALVEEDRVIAMYHGTEVGNMVATSSDPLLLNWAKVAGKAVVPMTAPDGSALPYRVFDPCIWKKGDAYYSLSAGTKPEGPAGQPVRANFLLRSEDLEHWEYLHPFVEDDDYTLVGDDGACPYFWPIGDRHILLFFSHMSGGQYLLGDYDTDADKFIVTRGGKFNFGASTPSGVHAPSATPDGQGGVIALFNMNPGKPTPGWNQIMTLPRRLTVNGDDLLQEPVEALTSLRSDHVQIGEQTLAGNSEILFEDIQGDSLELIARVETDAPMFELDVLRSAGREEVTRICFYRDRGFNESYQDQRRRQSHITIDTSCSSLAADVRPRAPETAPIVLGAEETLELRVFIDRSVVEVFVNGRQALAVRVYPERHDSLGVSMRSQGTDSRLLSLDAWTLASIWD